MKKSFLKKLMTCGLLITVVLFLPARAFAFWPFDKDKGQVKGVVVNRFGTDQKIGTMGVGKEKKAAVPAEAKFNSKGRLSQVVKNGKISQSQANEILNRREVIKTKRQELKALEKSLVDWIKSNRLPAELGTPEVQE